MSYDFPGCKISVIKRTVHQDLIDEYLDVRDLPGFKKKRTALAGCSDWFRPVIFKIERLE